jgi:hypothetical protein
MLRVIVTIVVPLLLPTAIYLTWMRLAQRSPPAGAMAWATLPWLWLAAAGVVLLAFVLLVVTVGFGTSQTGVYVPPHTENGRIVPGHFEPPRAR